ncbi:glutaredoxin family protein [Immundisolibacter sp.]
MRLKLYVTAGCHLCEDAHAVLAQVGLAQMVERVEIGYDVLLAERYGWRIPVLRIEPGGVEIDWPFAASDLLAAC